MAKKVKYYAVKIGRTPGIYRDWASCKEQVDGYKGAIYKSFASEEEAVTFICEEKVEREAIEGLDAYVDGSYRASDASYSYGVVLYEADGVWEDSRRFRGDMAEMRNVAGEILGAKVAMKRAIEAGYNTLILHYDYAGIEHWAKGEWQRNKKGTIDYKDFYDSIKDKLTVHFVKVAAHTGVEGNERADTLAKEAEF